MVGALVLSPTDAASQEPAVGSAQRVVVARALLIRLNCMTRMIPLDPTIVCTCYDRPTVVVVVVVVVFTLETVLTSIQYFLFLTLQGKETNFRGHKLTQNKIQKKIK